MQEPGKEPLEQKETVEDNVMYQIMDLERENIDNKELFDRCVQANIAILDLNDDDAPERALELFRAIFSVSIDLIDRNPDISEKAKSEIKMNLFELSNLAESSPETAMKCTKTLLKTVANPKGNLVQVIGTEFSSFVNDKASKLNDLFTKLKNVTSDKVNAAATALLVGLRTIAPGNKKQIQNTETILKPLARIGSPTRGHGVFDEAPKQLEQAKREAAQKAEEEKGAEAAPQTPLPTTPSLGGRN